MIRALVIALALPVSALAAQESALVGVWKISYAGELRITNGVADPVMMTGTLTVEARQDSLIANLVTDPSPDRPTRPPLRLATRASGSEAVFESRSQATMNRGGAESTATAISTWSLRASGDQLEGTLERRIEGMDGRGRGPQPIRGTRQVK